MPEPSGDGTWVSDVVPCGGFNSYSYSYGTTFSTCYVYRDTVPLRFSPYNISNSVGGRRAGKKVALLARQYTIHVCCASSFCSRGALKECGPGSALLSCLVRLCFPHTSNSL